MHRVGLAGFGFMGQFHYRAYRELGKAPVTAIFDADPKAFERAVQGNLGAAALEGLADVAKFTDYDKFLASDVDVIDICAPTFLHRDFAERALRSGRAVLVEKPMALTVADCDAIISTARSTGKLLMVAQCVRFWPGYDLILEACRKGTYGRCLSATLRRIGGAPAWSGWFLKESLSGGGILDCLVHDFDFARASLGLPSAISGRGTVDSLGPDSGVGYCRSDLDYARGPSSVTIEGGWTIGSAFPFSMTAFYQFEEATIAYGIEPGAPFAIYRKSGEKELPVLSDRQGYYFELDYFLRCLDEGARPDRCPPEESRDAIAMARRAEEAIRNARR